MSNPFIRKYKIFKWHLKYGLGSAKGLCLMHTITSILSLLHKVIKSSQTTHLILEFRPLNWWLEEKREVYKELTTFSHSVYAKHPVERLRGKIMGLVFRELSHYKKNSS